MKKNRYGNIEDIVLEATLVTPTGAVETLHTTPRNSTGIQPRGLLFGSEGNLGIITKAVLKIHPQPEVSEYGSLVFKSFAQGVEYLQALRQTGPCRPRAKTASRPCARPKKRWIPRIFSAFRMGFLGVRAGSLSNKTVVITGASAGLGATLAVECAQQGARLVLLARNAERLEAVARECEQLGSEVLTVVGDVAVAEDGRRLVEAAIERFGRIDYLVANAGVSMWTEFAAIEDVTLFRKLMEVNYLGAVHCVHPALSHLKKSKGLFVVISSIQGQVGVPLHTGYSASKHALQGFCDALRMEVAESGVGVMTVLLHWLKGTELRQRALGRDGKALGAASREHRAGAVSLEKAAQAIVRGMLKRRRQLYVPRRLRLLAVVHSLWPVLAEWVVKGKVAREEE